MIAYDLSCLNTDYDLSQLIRGLQNYPSGRIFLYGYPGTGKTEFVHYLAEKMGLPVIEKKASDILSPYIGVTEQNISRVFKQAQDDNAILLLDEADSFLQARSKAFRSWEITQVNEMLVRMEAFQGIFFCSTNLKETLDEASIRRFDLKIKFDFMTYEQRWNMFTNLAKEFNLRKSKKKSGRDKIQNQTTGKPDARGF